MLQLLLLSSLLASCSTERSFTLVLDTTNSMEAEILVVRANIAPVLSSLNGYTNYVLVSFKDSVVEPVFSTQSVSEYIDRLNSILAGGGADCPEDALAGVAAALAASAPRSTVFVFTDGYAKDAHNFRAVEALCRETHTQVIIFLSGHCLPSARGPAGSVQVYYDVARACSGAMLKWDSLVELREAFKYMREVVRTDWTNVTTYDSFVDYKPFSFSVDRFTRDLMVVVSGAAPRLQLAEQAAPADRVLATRQALVVRIPPAAAPGEVAGGAHARGAATLTFYERSAVPFQFGFSTRAPRSMRETSARPLPGSTNYMLITAEESIRLRSVEWLPLGDSGKRVLLLEQLSAGTYVTSVFVDQGKTCRFWVIGEDVTNERQIKGASTLLAPQVPVNDNSFLWAAPEVEILDTDLGLVDFGSALTLAARVVGVPKPDVSWKDGTTGDVLTSETILLEIPSVYISYVTIPNVSHNSTVSCLVANSEGRLERSVAVFVNRTMTFDVIDTPADASVEYGVSHRLPCRVEAYPEASVQWYLNGSLVASSGARLAVEEDALLIKEMGFEDVGAYECRAANELAANTFTAQILITGVEAPEIDGTETEVNLKPGEMSEIECRITKGKPDPVISWKYKSFEESEFGALPGGAGGDPGRVVFADASSARAGLYRCVATNVVGDDTRDFNVRILSPPVLAGSAAESVSVRAGARVRLPCEAGGAPRAAVRWARGDAAGGADLARWTDARGTLQFTAQASDSGSYVCVAENEAGRAERRVQLGVLVPPYISSQPGVFSVRAGAAAALPCAVARARPPPALRWEFRPLAPDSHTTHISASAAGELALPSVSARDAGSYRCIAENSLGADSVTHRLVVQ